MYIYIEIEVAFRYNSSLHFVGGHIGPKIGGLGVQLQWLGYYYVIMTITAIIGERESYKYNSNATPIFSKYNPNPTVVQSNTGIVTASDLRPPTDLYTEKNRYEITTPTVVLPPTANIRGVAAPLLSALSCSTSVDRALVLISAVLF